MAITKEYREHIKEILAEQAKIYAQDAAERSRREATSSFAGLLVALLMLGLILLIIAFLVAGTGWFLGIW